MANFYPLTVSKVQSLTPNAVAVTFDIPETLRETFNFLPGQYITIKKEVDGKELRRAYSISSSPEQNSFTIGIKKVDGGGFSDYANTQLAEGDELEVMPPEGRFVYDANKNSGNISAFAAGSGITPIMSISRAVLEKDPQSTFVLVYGNQSIPETMFYEELKSLKVKYPDRFFLYYVLSRAREEDTLFGRIDSATVNYIFKNRHKDLDFSAHYLCGPEPMIHLISDKLKENGVDERKIFYELFTTTETEEEATDIPEGQTELTVLLDDEEYSLTMNRQSVVLDAVLNENIDAPYSCQGGVCSTCIARITEGKAEMEKNQILTDSEIAEGFVLTCQAHPTTPVLKVDYDDV